MTVKTARENGFALFQRETDVSLDLLLKKYISQEISGQLLNSGNEHRSVAMVEYQGKKFIIKHDREIDRRIEKKIANFISGPFYSRLIRQFDLIAPEARACTADFYYVAEKTKRRLYVEVYTIHEYIEGFPLAEIDSSNKNEVRECIIQLHKAGLASNDIHPGNFIRMPDGELKIIDLSCRGNIRICQANDIITLRRKYNITVEGRGLIYRVILLKERFRQLSRRLRGKKSAFA